VTTIEARFQLKLAAFELQVDLQLPASGISVIFGASGSGKTLLMRCFAGLEQPQLGYCSVNNILWQDSTKNYALAAYQRPLAYVFQEACLFPHLNVRQNIDYGRKRTTGMDALGLQAIIELLNIGHLLDRKPEKLSGGEQQRVALARALAVKPQLLLMDEPLAALDQAHKQEILPYLRRLQQALALPILYVTHSLSELMQLADHLVLMEQGRVRASGNLPSLLTRLDLPFARSQQAASVISAEVLAYDHEFQLLQLKFSGGIISIPQLQLPLGSQVRLQVDARDVSLSLQAPTAVETCNSLPAKVVACLATGFGYITLSLQLGSELLVAQLSLKAAAHLKLEVGQRVYAEIKQAMILN